MDSGSGESRAQPSEPPLPPQAQQEGAAAVPPQAAAEAPASLLLSLPQGLLHKILGDVQDSGGADNELLGLREVCKKLKEEVDGCLSALTLSWESHNEPEEPESRLPQFLQSHLRRWPRLTALRLRLTCGAEPMHAALLTLAEHRPRLEELSLAVEWDEDEEPQFLTSLHPLNSLANLRVLSLDLADGDQMDDRDAVPLTLPPSLQELSLYLGTKVSLEPLPSLRRLAIAGQEVLGATLPDIPLCSSLVKLELKNLALDALSLPSTLEELTLSSMSNADVDAGSHLPSLHTLRVDDSRVSGVETLLSSGSSLTTLTLTHVLNSRSLAGLEHHASLSLLKLSYVENFHDVPDLSGLTSLRELHISHSCEPNALRAFTSLPDLQLLKLEFLGVNAFPGLGGLTSLTNLSIVFTQLTDIGEVTCLTNLRALSLYQLPLVTFPDLSPLTSLTTLGIYHVRCIDKLPFLTGLQLLEHVELKKLDGLEKLPPLESLTSLAKLDVEECPRLELGQLVFPPSIEELRLAGLPRLTRNPTLANLGSLRILEIVSCLNFTRAVFGRGLTSLWGLDLSDCASLSWIEGLTLLPELEAVEALNCPKLDLAKFWCKGHGAIEVSVAVKDPVTVKAGGAPKPNGGGGSGLKRGFFL